MGNSRSFDASEKQLERSIKKRCDAGDLYGALRLMNRRNSRFGITPQAAAQQARTYFRLGYYDQALRTWYVCMHLAWGKKEWGETVPFIPYGGILECYSAMGEKGRVNSFRCPGGGQVTVLFGKGQTESAEKPAAETDPRDAEVSQSFLQALSDGDMKRAYGELGRFPKDSPYYQLSCATRALLCVATDGIRAACDFCRQLIEKEDMGVIVYLICVGGLMYLGEQEEAQEVAESFDAGQGLSADDQHMAGEMYGLCGLHQEALRAYSGLCDRDDAKSRFGRELLFRKAAAAFNAGRQELCDATFDTLLTVYPYAEAARRYRNAAREYAEMREQDSDTAEAVMSYRCDLPDAERARCVSLLRQLKKSDLEEGGWSDARKLYDLCFDSSSGEDTALQQAAVRTAVRLGDVEYVQGILLDPYVAQDVRDDALRSLAKRNRDGTFGVAADHTYSRISFYRFRIGNEKRVRYLTAYAEACLKYGYGTEARGKSLAAAAESLYDGMRERGVLDLADATKETACAICVMAGKTDPELGKLSTEQLAAVFSADAGTLEKILSGTGTEAED